MRNVTIDKSLKVFESRCKSRAQFHFRVSCRGRFRHSKGPTPALQFEPLHHHLISFASRAQFQPQIHLLIHIHRHHPSPLTLLFPNSKTTGYEDARIRIADRRVGGSKAKSLQRYPGRGMCTGSLDQPDRRTSPPGAHQPFRYGLGSAENWRPLNVCGPRSADFQL